MNTTPMKFLVWCDNKKEFEKDEVFACQDGSLVQIKNLRPLRNDTHFIMQLTALRSTTGEKIYNHMIVKARHEEYAYEKHYFVDMFNYKVMAYLSDCNLEIVGNRFQSPELLELCK